MTKDELIELFAAADRTPAWLARRLGVSRPTVGRWVQGERPVPASRVEKIRELLVPLSVSS